MCVPAARFPFSFLVTNTTQAQDGQVIFNRYVLKTFLTNPTLVSLGIEQKCCAAGVEAILGMYLAMAHRQQANAIA